VTRPKTCRNTHLQVRPYLHNIQINMVTLP
jgi:hypothetical protein